MPDGKGISQLLENESNSFSQRAEFVFIYSVSTSKKSFQLTLRQKFGVCIYSEQRTRLLEVSLLGGIHMYRTVVVATALSRETWFVNSQTKGQGKKTWVFPTHPYTPPGFCCIVGLRRKSGLLTGNGGARGRGVLCVSRAEDWALLFSLR